MNRSNLKIYVHEDTVLWHNTGTGKWAWIMDNGECALPSATHWDAEAANAVEIPWDVFVHAMVKYAAEVRDG